MTQTRIKETAINQLIKKCDSETTGSTPEYAEFVNHMTHK